MSNELDSKILELVSTVPVSAAEILGMLDPVTSQKTFNARLRALVNAGKLERIEGSPITFALISAEPAEQETSSEGEAKQAGPMEEIPAFIPETTAAGFATELEAEIAAFNQGAEAMNVLDKRCRPEDLDQVMTDLDTLASGIEGTAPVSAALLAKAKQYLEHSYQL